MLTTLNTTNKESERKVLNGSYTLRKERESGATTLTTRFKKGTSEGVVLGGGE